VPLQTSVTAARVYYDKVAANVIAELERYRTDLRVDLKAVCTHFLSAQVRLLRGAGIAVQRLQRLSVCLQVRAATKLERSWGNIVADTSAAVIGEGGTPFPLPDDTPGGGAGALYDGSGAFAAIQAFARSGGAVAVPLSSDDASAGAVPVKLDDAPFAEPAAVPMAEPQEYNQFTEGGYADVGQ
jgi:hypothetical protein